MEDKFERLLERVSKLEEENKQLKKEIDSLRDSEKSASQTTENSKVSRRNFLKFLGLGASGLAASSVAAGALTLDKNGISKSGNSFWHEGTFQKSNYIPLDGTQSMTGGLTIGGDLTAKDGEKIWDESNSRIPSANIEQGTGSGLNADTVDGSEAADLGFSPSSPQDVTSSRSTGTQYTNNTGGPIRVIVAFSGQSVSAELYIDGLKSDEVYQEDNSNEGRDITLSGIVPDGSTYQASGGMIWWVEQSL